MHDFRGIQNPWRCQWSDEIQKKGRFFFGKSCSRDFGAPGCNPCTLIDLANTALASRSPLNPISMILNAYRTKRGVTGPMNFKKSGCFFFGKSCSRGFGATGCHPDTLIDLENIALVSKHSAENICMISEGYRTHRGVTGPKNFKKSGGFFFGNSCSRGFGAPGYNPSTLIDFANAALTSKDSVEPIYMILEG